MYFWISQSMGMPKLFGVLMAVAFGIALGILKYQLIVKHFEGIMSRWKSRHSFWPLFFRRVSSWCLEIAQNSVAIIPGVVYIAGVPVTYNILAATLASWVILGGLYLFIKNTHTGRAMQAVSMDTKGAAISGIVPDHINMITWAISGGLGALGGVFFASYTQLAPSMWVAPPIISVAVVIVGGIGSIIGTLIVAHVVGFMEVSVVSLLSPELRGVFTMLLIILVLVMRPQGLFGREEL